MKTWAAVGTALGLYASSFYALSKYDAGMLAVEYLSVPAAVSTHALAAGYENIAADMLYLQFIHYFGKHLRSKQRYHNVTPLLELITDLDPHFEGAYGMGAMALGDNGQVDESEALWAKGVKANPGNWAFPYQAGMSLFLFGDRADQFLRAAALFKAAAALPGAPPEARYMEARMYQATNRREMAVAIWRNIYLNSPSAEERAVAERSLHRWGVVPPPRTKGG